MSSGHGLKACILACAAGFLSVASADAQVWSGTEERSQQGLHTATLFVQMHEFALQITCNETAAENGRLDLMFVGPALPRLYGTDGQEETMLLSFGMFDGSTVTRGWNAYYYDGGLGDQAWLGGLMADGAMLDAFAAAREVALLNTDKELIYVFPAKGTAAGAKLLRQTCGVGQAW